MKIVECILRREKIGPDECNERKVWVMRAGKQISWLLVDEKSPR
jgi:hypothetical protein